MLVDGCGGEVAALHAGLETSVRGAIEVGLRTAVPPTLVGVHLVETIVDLGAVAHGVKDVELCLGAEVTGISNAGGGEVLLRLAGDIARVAAEGLQRERVVDEELDVQRLGRAEGIHKRGCRVRQESHIGLIDGGETTDGGAIESEALLACFFGELISRDGKVVFGAGNVREADVNELDVLFLDELDDVLDCLEGHGSLLLVDL